MPDQTTIDNIRFARQAILAKDGPLSHEDRERLDILDKAESEAEVRLKQAYTKL